MYCLEHSKKEDPLTIFSGELADILVQGYPFPFFWQLQFGAHFPQLQEFCPSDSEQLEQ